MPALPRPSSFRATLPLLIAAAAALAAGDPEPSPYAGQESRAIKSLSAEDIEALESGSGVAFGGMAKAAELNGYPGPRHVLELAEELELTPRQRAETERLYAEMKALAVALGRRVLEQERALDDAFRRRSIDAATLSELVRSAAELQGSLRALHLSYHLKMAASLAPGQIASYNQLRGYAGGDPCTQVPAGHDPDMWRRHHGCRATE